MGANENISNMEQAGKLDDLGFKGLKKASVLWKDFEKHQALADQSIHNVVEEMIPPGCCLQKP